LTVKAHPPGTEPRIETSLERHPRPDCTVEQSAETFQKVYSVRACTLSAIVGTGMLLVASL
jgi:hypothetical protein